MPDLKLVLSKTYWVLVAGVPFYPAYELYSLQDRLACAYGSPCFEYGLPYQVEGIAAGITTGLILWPVCIWRLGGKALWERIMKSSKKT